MKSRLRPVDGPGTWLCRVSLRDAAWQIHSPEWDGRRSEAGQRGLGHGFCVNLSLILLADTAARVCLDQWQELGWALEDAYALAWTKTPSRTR